MSNANDFVIERKTLVKYIGEGGDVVIPEDVTKIASRVFWQNNDIVSVTVSEGVKEIGFRTFANCENLEKVVLPAGIKKIPNEAFSFCKNLKSIELSEGITEIGKEAFNWCGKLETVVIPEGVTQIGDFAFAKCENLTSVHLPQSLVKVGECAFSCCEKLSEINIPEGLTEIGRGAFSAVAMPLLIIHNQVHGGTGEDGHVTIPDGVEAIRAVAFFEKELKSITIPDSINVIEENAVTRFDGELKIKCSDKIWNLLWDSIKQFSTEEKAVFCLCHLRSNDCISSECKKIIGYISREKDKIFDLIVKSDDTESMMKLLSIIKKPAAHVIDGYIKKCKKSTELTAILLEYKEKGYSKAQIEQEREELIEKELGIKERTVADWKEIFTFKVTDGTVVINSYKGKEAVVEVPEFIGKNPVTAIGDKAFSKENSTYRDDRKIFFEKELTEVVLPQSVTQIGEGAFSGCEKLKTVILPSKLKKIEAHTFYRCKSLERIDLPRSITSIGQSAFSNCESLLNIKIPGKVKKIQHNTFIGCKSLESISLPEGVKFIGEDVFYGCEKLKEFNLPAALVELGQTAFCGCKALADEKGFVIVGGILYNYYGTDTAVTVPENVIAIANRCFEKNKNITSVTLPEGVILVGHRAFAGCEELENVTIPQSLNETESCAFDDCPKIKFIIHDGRQYVKMWDGRVIFIAE